MLSDEQLIELLRKIKEYCHKNTCSECIFHSPKKLIGTSGCQIGSLAKYLEDIPNRWNMKEIERIIKK